MHIGKHLLLLLLFLDVMPGESKHFYINVLNSGITMFSQNCVDQRKLTEFCYRFQIGNSDKQVSESVYVHLKETQLKCKEVAA